METPEHGYACAPWELRWRGFDAGQLRRTESIFALSNGHIGMRGTLDEGEPRGLPGTYLNGFYEQHELPYAESGFGYPEEGQTVVNATDGKVIRLLVNDEPLDLRYGMVTHHERVLDFRSGTLRRTTEWTSPTGHRVRLRSERLVSFTQRAVAAVHYEVEPLDDEVQLVAQSDLLANEPVSSESNDPRVAAALHNPLAAELAVAEHYRAILAHHTRRSGLAMAAAMDHDIAAPDNLRTRIRTEDDLARLTVATDVAPGQSLRITKYLSYGWSAKRSTPALRAQVEAALAGALQTGWEGLLAEQRDYLDRFWESADITVDGDPELQQAVRFALLHILQAGARGESRAIPGKGLTGPGYDGHAFWDTEAFVLPVLTYTQPYAARDALRWRHATLDKARARARLLGFGGSAFPWRSINGAECSAYWPAGTAAMHISAAIADATTRYVAATGDHEFDAGYGTELLLETARLWISLGHHDQHDGFRIDGVTGPDEYSAVSDNNVYTNLMARRNLYAAASVCSRHPDRAALFGVDESEIASWRRAAEDMRFPYDDLLAVHPQADGWTAHAEWDFDATPAENYPLLLNYPYFDLYRKQVIKQADLVLAMHLCGDAFTDEQKSRNFAYYEARTVRDSSLSAGTQAVLAAEVGHMELAYDYLAEAALTDLHDLHGNAANGLHMASLAGAWTATVAGFGGMRDHEGELTFAPRLPDQLDRVTFRMCYRDARFLVDIRQNTASYQLLHGTPVWVRHYRKPLTIDAEPTTMAIPEVTPPPRPAQPAGCAPERRDAERIRRNVDVR